ncbi:hypothetical protein PC9H_000536 [Pleurotus ostreatus]|uniref:tRNA(Ile)-lysidine synthetase n=1 Tax=Pleurotus ostreatus TaxID=5322 RepID=A0A8H7A4Z2_PLEOS|nr:uncharacterized protein PC9H_000536 [Pleurotus ostreatus]KAF7440192.1 hypothetical protein PC9H_000536 [Pleurotus ostreatus]
MGFFGRIHGPEFTRLFLACTPPGGWPRTIAVANSGGPDSSCLLFLLHELMQATVGATSLPKKVVSLTVDHGLQAESALMAEQAAGVASKLGVEHHTVKIPWGETPFPPIPAGDNAFESIARLARFRVLFEAMKKTGALVLALGHHADDQVETSLIRIAKGTTEMGAGGMRKCRRWGMGLGKEGDLGWTGYEGMSRWMVRPLLSVRKEKILATCKEAEISYVQDKTNFQPEITIRNAIRHIISNGEAFSQTLPEHIREGIENMQARAESLEGASFDLSAGSEQLRATVLSLGRRVDDIDEEVNAHLKAIRVSGPPGTFVMSHPTAAKIQNETTRARIIQRILRYVSFHPWGSLRADGNRRGSSLSRIVANVWDPQPQRQANFIAGGGVMWIPAVFKHNKLQFIDFGKQENVSASGSLVWVATRAPPLGANKLKAMNMDNPLNMDVTSALLAAVAQYKHNPSAPKTVEFLYDCRFVVTFDISKIPNSILRYLEELDGRLFIITQTRWYWPRVVLKPSEGGQVVLESEMPRVEIGTIQQWRWEDRSGVVKSKWIESRWIRPLDAI